MLRFFITLSLLIVARPAFAQGAVAHVATKLWFEENRVLIVVPSPMAPDFEEHLP